MFCSFPHRHSDASRETEIDYVALAFRIFCISTGTFFLHVDGDNLLWHVDGNFFCMSRETISFCMSTGTFFCMSTETIFFCMSTETIFFACRREQSFFACWRRHPFLHVDGRFGMSTPYPALYISSWKRASRHICVHFFDISTSKMLRTWCALYIFTWKRASRHNGVQFFISHLARWLRTRRFSEPTFRPSGATNHWRNTVFPTFSRTCIFFLLTLSLDYSLLWSSLPWLFPSLLFICPYCRKFDF